MKWELGVNGSETDRRILWLPGALLAGLFLSACAAASVASRASTTDAESVARVEAMPTTTTTLSPTAIASPTTTRPRATPTRTLTPWPTPIVDHLRADLAGRLHRPVSNVSVVAVEPQRWTDRCMDLLLPPFDCPAADFPGYRVILSVGGGNYEYHTNDLGEWVIVPSPSTVANQVLLEVHREGDGFCDTWRVFGDQWTTYEAPCRGRGPFGHYPLLYPPSEHFHALREVVLTTLSFTEEIKSPQRITGVVYGLGMGRPGGHDRAIVRDFMRWLANPSGEGDPGRCVITNPTYTYALDYPCNWELERLNEGEAPGVEWATIYIFSPGRGAPYAPPYARVAISTTPMGGKGPTPAPVTLAEFEKERLQHDYLKIIERQEIELGGIAAIRALTEHEAFGRSLVYLLIVDGRGFELVGHGDLTAAEEIIKTFRRIKAP